VHGVQSQCVTDPVSLEVFCPTSFPNPVSIGNTWNDSIPLIMAQIIATEQRALWLAGALEFAGSPPPPIGLDAWYVPQGEGGGTGERRGSKRGPIV
jgi:hypothetical protein